MFGTAIFLALLFTSILDVSFLSRLTVLGVSPIFSLVIILMLAIFSKDKRNFLWVIIPVSIISVFSEFSWGMVFIAFIFTYFIVRQRKTYFWENQTVCKIFNVCFSIIIFFIILKTSSIFFGGEKFSVNIFYSAGIFMIIEMLLFYSVNWIYYYGQTKRIW